MMVKNYSKMALIALAAASLTFAGCGGKNSDSSSNNQQMMDSKQAAANGTMTGGTMADGTMSAGTMAANNLVAKPSTNSVYFSFNSAEIDDAGTMILTAYAAWLKANTDVSITVEGNCDERGSREYNLALGEQRAQAVRSALIANGVAADRVDTISFGEERPVCSSTGEACWAQNRHGDVVNR